MLSLISRSRPNCCRKACTAAASKSYWCLVGSIGFGSMSSVPREADLVLVLDDQLQEAAELLELAAQVGVEQRVVALAAAPQHVVRAAEPVRHLERLLHLRRGVGEHLGIGIGRRAGGVAPVAEQVGRAPEQPHAGARHLRLDALEHAVEQRVALAQRRAFGRDVAIVEA